MPNIRRLSDDCCQMRKHGRIEPCPAAWPNYVWSGTVLRLSPHTLTTVGRDRESSSCQRHNKHQWHTSLSLKKKYTPYLLFQCLAILGNATGEDIPLKKEKMPCNTYNTPTHTSAVILLPPGIADRPPTNSRLHNLPRPVDPARTLKMHTRPPCAHSHHPAN